jgi:hypothetical protein
MQQVCQMLRIAGCEANHSNARRRLKSRSVFAVAFFGALRMRLPSILFRGSLEAGERDGMLES